MRLLRLAATLALVGVTAGCGLWSEEDYYQYRTVTYFAVVAGPHDTATVWYTTGDGLREEQPESAVFQTTVRGKFHEVIGLDLQINADVEPAQSDLLPVLPPIVSCGIAVDGTMYQQATHGYTTTCHVDFEEVKTRPQAAPAEPDDPSVLTVVLWLGAVVLVAGSTARWAYFRRQRSAPAPASEEARPAGYERRPHLRFMLLCGLVGAVAFVIVFVVAVLFQPTTASRNPIPSVTDVPPGLTSAPSPPTGR